MSDEHEELLRVAALVQRDGQERGLESESNLDHFDDFVAVRVELRDLLRTGPLVDGERITHVRPWLWRAATSRGRPLTRTGTETGYEIRLSRYTRSQVLDAPPP
jgi:hypothetical protein